MSTEITREMWRSQVAGDAEEAAAELNKQLRIASLLGLRLDVEVFVLSNPPGLRTVSIREIDQDEEPAGK